MSKAIIRIDIPTDYADEYKQWIIDGRLCYLEDNAWTHLKDVECKVEPYREVIPVEWIKKYLEPFYEHYNALSPESQEVCGAGWVIDALETMMRDWEKENGKSNTNS